MCCVDAYYEFSLWCLSIHCILKCTVLVPVWAGQIKKALRGVKVEVTHRGSVRRKYRISGLTSQPTRELMYDLNIFCLHLFFLKSLTPNSFANLYFHSDIMAYITRTKKNHRRNRYPTALVDNINYQKISHLTMYSLWEVSCTMFLSSRQIKHHHWLRPCPQWASNI